VIYCRDGGAVVSAKESENHMTQIALGDEEGSESDWYCGFVLAKVSRGRLSCVAVVMASANSLRIVLGEAEESGTPCSFWFVSVEEVSGIEKRKVSVWDFCSLNGVAVCVIGTVIENATASGWDFSLCYVGAATEIVSETSSWNSYYSLTGCRYGHENCARDFLLAVEVQVQA
jgi:hypothetical protein